MKKILSLLLFSVLSIFSVAVLAQAADQNAPAANQGNVKLSPMAKKAGVVLETLIIVNTSEINAAKLAEKKSANADVKNFAAAMERDHTKGLQAAREVSAKTNIIPVATQKTKKMEEGANAEYQKLSALDGKSFDTAYAEAMVKGHESALKLIDNKLLPNAKNPEVVNLLKGTRGVVESHLKMAQDLQKKLSS